MRAALFILCLYAGTVTFLWWWQTAEVAELRARLR